MDADRFVLIAEPLEFDLEGYDPLYWTHYVTPIRYKVQKVHYDESGMVASREDAGWIDAFRINAGDAFNADVHIIQEADHVTQAVYEATHAFYNEGGPLHPENLESPYFDLLYIDTVFVEPQFRGQDLGHHLVNVVRRHHGQNAHIALKPCPLEPEAQGPESIAKLNIYWSRLGLHRECYPYLWADADTYLTPPRLD